MVKLQPGYLAPPIEQASTSVGSITDSFVIFSIVARRNHVLVLPSGGCFRPLVVLCPCGSSDFLRGRVSSLPKDL